MGIGPVQAGEQETAPGHPARRALRDAAHHLKGRALKLAGYLLVAYVVLKLIPALKDALHSLEHVSWEWVAAAIGLELLSETGFVVAWSAIVDPQKVLGRGVRGRRMDQHVAWAQLGGGLIVPGGSWGGMGVGAVILHRFGMPTKLIAERQLNLSFLNTAVDALALVIFGVGLATRILSGEGNLLLTLLPAALAAAGIAAVLLIGRRTKQRAGRLQTKHHRVAAAVTTLSDAVQDTERLLLHRGSRRAVLGIMAYLGFDVLMLWSAFLAVDAHPVPSCPVVIMAYIIGALGGSIPLPGAAGTIGGMTGMLIVYGVNANTAVAAVLLHQAIGLLVPLTGGVIAYAIIRHRLGPIRPGHVKGPRGVDPSEAAGQQ
ncbi:MAG: lysylphosphatidylglycerol synthase transmembrane domain-containing protein [Solirubrobacteraceae bacterium]